MIFYGLAKKNSTKRHMKKSWIIDFNFTQFWTENPCVGSSILPGATINNIMKPSSGFFYFPKIPLDQESRGFGYHGFDRLIRIYHGGDEKLESAQ